MMLRFMMMAWRRFVLSPCHHFFRKIWWLFYKKRKMTEFERTEKLYHFTNFESACKILASKTLLLSPLANLNDVNESFRTIYSKSEGEFFSWYEIGKKYRQLSLSEDDGGSPGFLNLPMWGYYGDKGRGVCIVLDKHRFIEELGKFKDKLWHGKIDYVERYDNDLKISNENDISANYDGIFFKKDRGWRHECEYRVVGYDKDLQKISIRNSLRWIILYYTGEDPIQDQANYKALAKLLGSEEKVLVYSRFLGEESLIGYSTDNAPVTHWSPS